MWAPSLVWDDLLKQKMAIHSRILACEIPLTEEPVEAEAHGAAKSCIRLEQKQKGTTVDEMVGCHHPFNGHEFEQTPGDSEG